MKSLKDAWSNRNTSEGIDLKTFPKPDYSHIIDNDLISNPIWIKFDDIFIDDDEGNPARTDGQSTSHIEELKYSFANGVQTSSPLGAVMERPLQPDGTKHEKPFMLMYGYGRSLAQIELGVDGWAFNTIDATETEWEDIQSYENEDVAPKSPNKERDIVQVKTKQINEGRLAKTENAVMSNLKKTYPSRRKPSLDRIAAMIFENVGIQSKYAYYSESKIGLWRDNHASQWFGFNGEWDTYRNQYGYTSVKGGVYRTWNNALIKYAETGQKSYVNCFANTVSKGSTLIDQRQSIVREYIKLRVNHAIVYGKNIKFLTLNGFFPQQQKVDNWKSFIELNQDDIELQVKQGINAARLRIRQAQAA